MCNIAKIIDQKKSPEPPHHIVWMIGQLHHRRLHDDGIFYANNIGLKSSLLFIFSLGVYRGLNYTVINDYLNLGRQEHHHQTFIGVRFVKIFYLVSLTVAIYLSFIPTVYAYLDPGTGSIILQMIVGGIAGVSVFLRLYWEKIKKIFNKQQDKKKTEN